VIVTAQQIKAILPQCMDPATWAKALNIACPQFGIDTPWRMAAFIAQVGHESVQLNRRRENLSYSVRALMNTWPRRFPTEQSATPYARNPEKLANYVYAGRLGNGDTASGDGWRYRGGGLIQLTGRTNYREAGEAIGVALEEAPQKIEQPDVAARSSAWWWQAHGCNDLADAGEFDKITETINGPAMLGAAARRELWAKAKLILAVASISV
jgi:putative chitinase